RRLRPASGYAALVGELEQRIELLVGLVDEVLGLAVREMAAQPQPVGPPAAAPQPAQVRSDQVEVLGVTEQQKRLVVRIARPAQRQDAMVGADARLALADPERGAASDEREGSRSDRLELDPQGLGLAHCSTVSASEQRMVTSSAGASLPALGLSAMQAPPSESSHDDDAGATSIRAWAGRPGVSRRSAEPEARSVVVAPVGRGGSVSVISASAGRSIRPEKRTTGAAAPGCRATSFRCCSITRTPAVAIVETVLRQSSASTSRKANRL